MLVLGEGEGGEEGEGEEEEQVPPFPVLESRAYIVGQKKEKKKCPPPPFSNRGNTVCANTEPRRAETGEGEEQVPYSPVLESRVYIVGQKQEKGKEKPSLPPSRIEGIQYLRIPGFVGQKKEKKEKKCPPPPCSNRQYVRYRAS